MPREVVWRLVVDESGAIKKMELFGKDAEKTDKRVKKTKHSTEELSLSFKRLGGVLGGLRSKMAMAFGFFGVSTLGFGLESVLTTTSSLLDETERFRAVTGMGAQASLDYVAALKARGIGTQAVTRAYKTLGKAVQNAERQQYTFAVGQEKSRAQGRIYTGLLGVQAEAFQELGISINQLRAMKPEQQFRLITEQLEKMPSGIKKAQIAAQLFGRGGNALLPVLEKGGLSLNHFREMAERFFPTLKGEGVKTLDELREKQAEAKLATEGLEFTFGQELAPTLSAAMGQFARWIAELKHGHGPLSTIKRDVEGLAHFGGGAAHFIKEIADALGIKLTGQTLGAVLAAAAAVKGIKTVHHTAKEASGAAKLFKTLFGSVRKAVTTVGGAAGLGGLAARVGPLMAGPLDIAALAGLDAFLGYKLVKNTISPTPAGVSEAREAEILKRGPLAPQFARTSPAHLQALEKLITHIELLHETRGESGKQIRAEMHLDGRKVGEVIALNPGAMRFLAEGVERSALSRNARK